MDEVRTLLIRNAELQTELRIVKDQLQQANNATTYLLQNLATKAPNQDHELTLRENTQLKALLGLTRPHHEIKTINEKKPKPCSETDETEELDLLSFNDENVDETPVAKKPEPKPSLNPATPIYPTSQPRYAEQFDRQDRGRRIIDIANWQPAPEPQDHPRGRTGFNIIHPDGTRIITGDQSRSQSPPSEHEFQRATPRAPPPSHAYPPRAPQAQYQRRPIPFQIGEHRKLAGLATFIEDEDEREQRNTFSQLPRDFNFIRPAHEYEEYYYRVIRPKYLQTEAEKYEGKATAGREGLGVSFASTTSSGTPSGSDAQVPDKKEPQDPSASFASSGPQGTTVSFASTTSSGTASGPDGQDCKTEHPEDVTSSFASSGMQGATVSFDSTTSSGPAVESGVLVPEEEALKDLSTSFSDGTGFSLPSMKSNGAAPRLEVRVSGSKGNFTFSGPKENAVSFGSTTPSGTASESGEQVLKAQESAGLNASFTSSGAESTTLDAAAEPTANDPGSQEVLACESPLLEAATIASEDDVSTIKAEPPFEASKTEEEKVDTQAQLQTGATEAAATSFATTSADPITAWKSFASTESGRVNQPQPTSTEPAPQIQKNGSQLALSIHPDPFWVARDTTSSANATVATEEAPPVQVPQHDYPRPFHVDIRKFQRLPDFRDIQGRFRTHGPRSESRHGGGRDRRGGRSPPTNFEHGPMHETELFANSFDPRTRRTVLITNIPPNTTLHQVLEKVRGGKIVSATYMETAGMRTEPYMETNTVMVVFYDSRQAAKFVKHSEKGKLIFFYSTKWEAPFKATAKILDSPSRPIPPFIEQGIRENALTRVVFVFGGSPDLTPAGVMQEIMAREYSIKQPIKIGFDEDGIMFFEFASMFEAKNMWHAIARSCPEVSRGFLRDPCEGPLQEHKVQIEGENADGIDGAEELEPETEGADADDEDSEGQGEKPKKMELTEAEETAMMIGV